MKKLIGFLFTVILSAGLTFVLVSGNFFMFNLVLKNETKAMQEMNEALAGYGYSHYYDLLVVEDTNTETEVTHNEITLKIAYNEDYDFNFVAHKKSTQTVGTTTETVEMDYYYVDGWLYTSNLETEEKTKLSTTFSSALDDVVMFQEIIIIEDLNVEDEFSGEETELLTNFDYSFKPFYIGLGYTFHEINETVEFNITFKLDLLKQLRGIKYQISMGENFYNIETFINSYNKALTLAIPTNLDAYVG